MGQSWWWLIVAVVTLGLAAKFVLPAFVGAAVSIRTAGRLYLSEELKKYGIRGLFPDASVVEIADHVAEFWTLYAQRRGEGPMWAKTQMIPDLERDSRVMLEWARGRDIAGDRISYIPETLKKYGVPLGIGNGTSSAT